MNITFFIGNGFDLNLGLQTTYMDFYKFFEKNASESNFILKCLKMDKEQDEVSGGEGWIKNWSDLETQLGRLTNRFDEIKEGECDTVSVFQEGKSELVRLLKRYLQQEEKNFNINDYGDSIADKFKDSIINFYKVETGDFSPKDFDILHSTFLKTADKVYDYQFVDFNYTNILDCIIDVCGGQGTVINTHSSGAKKREEKLGRVLHIHGTLNSELILGVNDETQLANELERNNPDLLDIMIKTRLNDQFGQKNTEEVKKLISNSIIICIYGMSIGETDKTWWKEIAAWLKKSEHHKLVIYYYEEHDKLNEKVLEEKYSLVKRKRNEFLRSGKIDLNNQIAESLKDRIIIIYNSEIFDFVFDEQAKKQEIIS